jgi:ATP synthase protein I
MTSDGKDLDPGRHELTPEERAAMRSRASELGKRLDEVKAKKAPPPRENGARGRAYGEAFRIVADLVVGVAVGGGIGWVLDRQLGTKPWLLVLMLVLGFAAGMSNVLRTARKMQAEAEPLQRAAKPVEDDEDDDQPGRGGAGPASPGRS